MAGGGGFQPVQDFQTETDHVLWYGVFDWRVEPAIRLRLHQSPN